MGKRRRFSDALEATRRQRRNDPQAKASKAELRRQVLQEIGASDAHVFDAFAGAGEMWRLVWRDAAGYVGCDRDWFADDRLAYVADNRRVMRCIDLAPFNVFDFDSFGSPWEQVLILSARRPVAAGERLGIVLTEGNGIDLSMGGMAAPLREIAGFLDAPAGAARAHGEIIERALAGMYERMGVHPVRRWHASGTTGARMRYIGLVVAANR